MRVLEIVAGDRLDDLFYIGWFKDDRLAVVDAGGESIDDVAVQVGVLVPPK